MGPLKMGHLTFAHPTFLCHTESQIYGVGYMTYSLHIIIPYLHHFSIICLPHTCSSNSLYTILYTLFTAVCHGASHPISYPHPFHILNLRHVFPFSPRLHPHPILRQFNIAMENSPLSSTIYGANKTDFPSPEDR